MIDKVMPEPTQCVNCKEMVSYDEDHDCQAYPDDSEVVNEAY